MAEFFSANYDALIASGKIEADARQAALAARFADLGRRLASFRRARDRAASPSLLTRLLRRFRKPAVPVRGLYIYGEVGRGKTMLMDLFFAASPVKRKRRAHFHEFMADVHERVHAFRQAQKNNGGGEDPVRLTAAALADEAWLLCFDEFHVTDIADAMILDRLFTRLFELGVVVVATSNLAPNELYQDGLNRALFLPFIALMEKQCETVRLDARVDFRLEKLTGVATWHVPASAEADTALDEAWLRLARTPNGHAHELMVKNRVVRVPRAAMGVARFSFAELCGQPLAAAEYLKIAHEFHTVILDRIPVMDFDRRNEAKRFIILVDTLYDNSVKLLASAEAEPDALYRASDGYEAQEFKRTASRLIEMRSQSYLGLPHGARASARPGWSSQIVET